MASFPNKNKTVFVAMSGGVDSSVAAALLKQQGYEVVGVTMCLNISHPQTRRPSCCGVEGINDARRAAGILGIPHYVLNFAKDFKQDIIRDFISEYCRGRTPNPCVRCNQFLKFDALYKKVHALGADYLATGHYARLRYHSRKKVYDLRRGKDANKDQSYFLYGTAKKIFPHLLFPVGDLTKDEVRGLARKFHLNTAEKAESQDICFVPDRNYKKFIREHAGEQYFVPGPYRDPSGKVIGRHQGILNYTIGQREGLGLSLGYPVYVYKIACRTNTVYVGPKEHLYAPGLLAGRMNWLISPLLHDGKKVRAQIRYNADPVAARLKILSKNRIGLDFLSPQRAVTPGQSVVLYARDVVLGGGVIDAALPRR